MKILKTRTVDTMKDLVSRTQAAEILGISTTAIDRYRDRGHLNAVPTANYGVYFLRSEVQAIKRRRAARLRKQAKKKSQDKAVDQIKVSKSETPNK